MRKARNQVESRARDNEGKGKVSRAQANRRLITEILWLVSDTALDGRLSVGQMDAYIDHLNFQDFRSYLKRSEQYPFYHRGATGELHLEEFKEALAAFQATSQGYYAPVKTSAFDNPARAVRNVMKMAGWVQRGSHVALDKLTEQLSDTDHQKFLDWLWDGERLDQYFEDVDAMGLDELQRAASDYYGVFGTPAQQAEKGKLHFWDSPEAGLAQVLKASMRIPIAVVPMARAPAKPSMKSFDALFAQCAPLNREALRLNMHCSQNDLHPDLCPSISGDTDSVFVEA